MVVHYLEIVSNDVDALTELYQRTHGLSFGPPDPDLGQARIATHADGAVVGIREPLAAHEQPIMRTYFAVEDIQHAVKEAEESGATIAYPPVGRSRAGGRAADSVRWSMGCVRVGSRLSLARTASIRCGGEAGVRDDRGPVGEVLGSSPRVWPPTFDLMGVGCRLSRTSCWSAGWLRRPWRGGISMFWMRSRLASLRRSRSAGSVRFQSAFRILRCRSSI
jgi:predicted enzyme related to lactoylglutathione lyase